MTTTINPVVQYRDLDAGARFLVETFGFVQHEAHQADDGSIQYVELSLNGAPLGLGPHTEPQSTCVQQVAGAMRAKELS